MPRLNLEAQSAPFLRYLERWLAQLPVVNLKDIAPEPRQAAIVSVDVINGFCISGPLASERVGRIVEPLPHSSSALGITEFAIFCSPRTATNRTLWSFQPGRRTASAAPPRLNRWMPSNACRSSTKC